MKKGIRINEYNEFKVFNLPGLPSNFCCKMNCKIFDHQADSHLL